jgi:ectoine hydroxylase-related dioxygenase (phytanoyl-CoA dioxygenase family)
MPGPDRFLTLIERDGFCVLEHAVDTAIVEALNEDLDERFEATPFCEGDFYGRRTKRFGMLLARSPNAAALVQNELVLAIAEALLLPFCDRFNLNLTQAIEIHPGAPAQFPHRDEDMWQGPKGTIQYLINVMWPLSPFTAENGATLIWPGTHKGRSEADLDKKPVAIAMEPGSALLFLGSSLHGGGANRSETVRRGLIVSYCLGWLKPFENQWLAYPPTVACRFPKDLAALVGYAQHRPNLGNYEGQCPSVLLSGDVPEHLAATDALRPDQAELLSKHVARGS